MSIFSDVLGTPSAAPQAEPTGEQGLEALATPQAEITAETGTTRDPAAKMHLTLAHLDQMRKFDRRSADVRDALSDVALVKSLSAVATEHNLSAPVVAAFRAIPGFEQKVVNFPESTLFNIVAEHPTSANSVVATEAFSASETQVSDALGQTATRLVEEFTNVLGTIDTMVASLRTQVTNDRDAIAASDVSDDVIAALPVVTMSSASMTDALTRVEAHLTQIDAFDADTLRAHPDQIEQEVRGLVAMVEDCGAVFGMTIDQFGLKDADRDAAFESHATTFGDMGIDKSGLLHNLSQADATLDALQALSDRKDAIVQGLTAAVTEMPAVTHTSEAQYGKVEHITLLNSYTQLATKMVREGIVLVATLLSTVDSALDVDAGQA
jgi:hypothetical protein